MIAQLHTNVIAAAEAQIEDDMPISAAEVRRILAAYGALLRAYQRERQMLAVAMGKSPLIPRPNVT